MVSTPPLFKRLRLDTASFDLTEDDPPAAAAAAAAAAAFPPFDELATAAAAAIRARDHERATAAAAAAAARDRDPRPRLRAPLAPDRVEAIRLRVREALRRHARGYGQNLEAKFDAADLLFVREMVKTFRVPGEDISVSCWWKYKKCCSMQDNEIGLEWVFRLAVANGAMAPSIIEAYRGRLALLPGCD